MKCQTVVVFPDYRQYLKHVYHFSCNYHRLYEKKINIGKYI